MTYILKTNNLAKTFQGIEAVSNVNMTVKRGEIYGILGPNGSGKTTIMKMLINLMKPTNGDIEIFGEKLTNSSYEILNRMGSIIEYPIFYEKLTAIENLELHCGYMGVHDKKMIDEALDLVNLKNTEKKIVKHFSLGKKQRLGIARAITTKPELLILDEPINGLDPAGIREIRYLFKMLSEEYGITILISSHILGEVEHIVNTVGVLRNGKLIEETSIDDIRERNTEYVELVTSDCKKAGFVLENKLHISNFKIVNDSTLRFYATEVPQSEISKMLIENDVAIESINRKHISLEDYFMNLTQEESHND